MTERKPMTPEEEDEARALRAISCLWRLLDAAKKSDDARLAAYRDLVLMLRSVPPLKIERKEAGPAGSRPVLSGRPTMADIQKKNRVRMIQELEEKLGGGSPEDRAAHRRRLEAQADLYAGTKPAGTD